jgi:hypothetical protein
MHTGLGDISITVSISIDKKSKGILTPLFIQIKFTGGFVIQGLKGGGTVIQHLKVGTCYSVSQDEDLFFRISRSTGLEKENQLFRTFKIRACYLEPS